MSGRGLDQKLAISQSQGRHSLGPYVGTGDRHPDPADDDPRTAESVSKVLLLARDKEIQDPTILQQIVAK